MNCIQFSFNLLLSLLLGQVFIFGQVIGEPFAWSPSSPINSINMPSDNVTTCYDSLHDRIFATWIDIDNDYPTYSIYSNGSWSSPLFIDTSGTSTGLRNVFTCYETNEDRVFAAWNDTNNSNFPTYSIFSNGSWSSPSIISSSIDVAGGSVFLCYNSLENKVFASWGGGDLGIPTFAIYSSGSWSVPASIDAASTIGQNVYICYNSFQNQMIATWANFGDGGLPTSSVYSSGAWGIPIGIGVDGVTVNVFPCYNSVNNEVIATWVDNALPTYAVFNGTNWSTPTLISSTEINGFASTLFSCFDSVHNEIFTAWPNDPDCSPLYTIYKNGSWSSPGFINMQPPGVVQDIFLLYNPLKDEVLATWADCISLLPYYSIYADTNPIAPIMPPINLMGEKKSNRFLTKTEWYNVISWSTPESGMPPAVYLIYRGNLSTQIGQVVANSPLHFVDHNVKKNKTYTYYIISVSANGGRSVPAEITVF